MYVYVHRTLQYLITTSSSVASIDRTSDLSYTAPRPSSILEVITRATSNERATTKDGRPMTEAPCFRQANHTTTRVAVSHMPPLDHARRLRHMARHVDLSRSHLHAIVPRAVFAVCCVCCMPVTLDRDIQLYDQLIDAERVKRASKNMMNGLADTPECGPRRTRRERVMRMCHFLQLGHNPF